MTMHSSQIRPRLSRDSQQKAQMFFSRFVGILLLATSVQAKLPETGAISGMVTDAKTGQPLPGVNIIVKNTVVGTSTNLDGEFSLSRLRPGTYEVMASIIGYKKLTMDNVTVSRDLPVILEFQLQESFVEMSPVVVTASRKSQSLAETANSVSVVSAAEIRKRNSFDIREGIGHPSLYPV